MYTGPLIYASITEEQTVSSRVFVAGWLTRCTVNPYGQCPTPRCERFKDRFLISFSLSVLSEDLLVDYSVPVSPSYSTTQLAPRSLIRLTIPCPHVDKRGPNNGGMETHRQRTI